MPDWKERELEDYLVANPNSLLTVLPFQLPSTQIDILGRQVPCTAGIIDLLAWIHSAFNSILVVECKAVHESGKTVEQVERYARCVSDVDIYARLSTSEFRRFGHLLSWDVSTVIVAPSFDLKFASTYSGYLLEALKLQTGFQLYKANRFKRTGQQLQLENALEPVIQRAIVDAMASSASESIRKTHEVAIGFSPN